MLWKKTKDGKFYVKSLYGALELGNIVMIPRRTIWSDSCSIGVSADSCPAGAPCLRE